MRWMALIFALAVYLGGFVVDHVEWQQPEWLMDLALCSPFAVVIAAARLWPILAWLAFPAVVIAVPVARYLRHGPR